MSGKEFAVGFILAMTVFVAVAVHAILFPVEPKPPIVIKIPRAERVGESIGNKAARFGKGLVRGAVRGIRENHEGEPE